MTRRSWSILGAAVGALALATVSGCKTDYVFESDNPWPDPNHYPSVGAGKIIVYNGGDDTITWIDVTTRTAVFHEPVGSVPAELEAPHDGTVMPDGSAYFISISNYAPGSGSGPHGSHGVGNVDGYLLEYSMQTHALIGRVELAHNPGEVEMTPDGRILVSHFDTRLITDALNANPNATYDELSSTVAIVDPKLMNMTDLAAGMMASIKVCPAEHGIIAGEDGKSAFITCYASDELAVLSLTPPYAVERYRVGEGTFQPTTPRYGPFVLEQSPFDGMVWVSTSGSGPGSLGDLRVFDPKTKTWDARGPVATGGVPINGEFSADGAYYIVANQYLNELVWVDTATHAIARHMPLPQEACENPRVPILLPDKVYLALICEGDHTNPGTVAFVNVAIPTPAVESYVTAGVFPNEAHLVEPPAP